MSDFLEPVATENKPAVSLASRLAEIKGKRLGFVDNSKLNADIFISRVSADLASRYGAIVGPMVRKFAPKDHLSEADIEKLAQCDAVVQCFGDCGTSTSISVADAVELEGRGIPTVTVFSTAFAEAARKQAAGRGLANLHLAKIPHPMHTAKPEQVTERADNAVSIIVERLTQLDQSTGSRSHSGAAGGCERRSGIVFRSGLDRRPSCRHSDG